MFKKLGNVITRVKWLVFGKPHWVHRNQVWIPCFRAEISDLISNSIWHGDYEKREMTIVSRHLEAKDIVLEMGSGIGYMATFCAMKIGSDRVYTFEANPSLIPIIKETFQKNCVSPHLENMMLGRGDGVEKFFPSDDFWASSTTQITTKEKAIEINRQDLNKQLADLAVTFLIVDIEGGEAELFDYADLSGVKQICLETHEDIIGNIKTTKVFTNILSQGFAIDFGLVYRNVYYFYRP